MENSAPEIKKPISESSKASKNLRYSWLDQFRGIVLIFLFISSLTWIFSANIWELEIPIGPTWLNYGFKYVDYYPRMITLIDLGSEIFMIIIGISIALSFQRKIYKNGAGYAWISVVNRIFFFFWLAEVMETNYLEWEINDIIIVAAWAVITIIVLILRFRVFTNFKQRKYLSFVWVLITSISWFFKFDFEVWTILFEHQLSLIAWGTLISASFFRLISKPDYRMMIPIIFLIIHYFLWAKFRDFSVLAFEGTIFEFTLTVPFKLISMSIVSIIGTCIWSWMHMDLQNQLVGIQKRIVPLMVITCVLHFIVDFFQPADSEGLNVSLTLLAISFSIFLMLCVYGIDKYVNYHAKFLISIGSNGLILFVLQAVLTIPYMALWPEGGDQFRTMVSEWFNITKTHVVVNFLGLIAFVLPIGILITTALLLSKHKIRVRV